MSARGTNMGPPRCVREIRSKRVPDTEENFEMCYCKSCPTYDECTSRKGEKLYCSRGKSGCRLERRGCVCGECNVAIKYALSSNYYCIAGVAKF
ncbi:DUF2769 domain-containing protein [Methanomassiliicoccus luminyensis]|uniref:DUF2769 domain-containing protein n=2 Tax=Methanomassiliicoccus luminyensis TaxID=1080712 RepID=UPI0003722171|nr:DUF2769 domain-containing protein [Methanomassiliicoccus luminyensis]